MNESNGRPIFFDPSRRRWPWLVRAVAAVSLAGTALLTVFLISIFVLPLFSSSAPRPKFIPDTESLVPHLKSREQKIAGVLASRMERRLRIERARAESARRRRMAALQPIHIQPPVVAGFYVNWQATSLASLRAHVEELTHFMPEWLHLNKGGTGIVDLGTERNDRSAERLVRANGIKIVPLLNNYLGDGWNDEGLMAMLTDPAKRAAVVSQVHEYLLAKHYQGITIDLETDNPDARDALVDFVWEMTETLRPDKLLVTVCVQVDDDAFDVSGLAEASDFIIPMLYDEHESTSEPGPIASQGWFEDQLQKVLKEAPADKVVMGIGSYGYDWALGKHEAQSPTFGEAMMTAKESQDGGDGVVKLDPSSLNPFFKYEEDGEKHVVWMLDAVTAHNELKYSSRFPVLGRALWYMGSEDPSIWEFFGRSDPPPTAGPISIVRYPTEVSFEGQGEILKVIAMPQQGVRKLKTDADGYITRENYTAYPTSCVVRRFGYAPKTVILTFDDGPDPEWTPQILDILKEKHVHAAFFMVGEWVTRYPWLVQRIWNEGHEIGNHSYYHPNFAAIQRFRARLELTGTERAIESVTGHTTPLFRPPYVADAEPSTVGEVQPLVDASELSYLTVGELIDPEDWDTEHGVTADKIVARVIRDRDMGNMILLHDAGGDRSQTVKALPIIIDKLRAMGYKFGTISQLIPGSSREKLFPPVSGQLFLVGIDRVVFEAVYVTGVVLMVIFWLSVGLGIAKVMLTTPLAIRQSRRSRRAVFDPAFKPSVSVVIAAYNEEKVIGQTVAALRQSRYEDLDIIVVDDGSTDGTSEVVKEQFGDAPNVRLLRKPNGGKASALNLGMSQATGEVIVSLDADTLFLPDTLPNLVRHFADPKVAAVSGNVKVGNRENLLTQWQSIEYITSQNFDRRAYDVLNCITVIPGAVGAWRRSAVVDEGGYQNDTLAEDMDLTWRLRLAGHRTVTDNSAVAFTEAPDRLRAFSRQRFRWTFGTLQCLWKHRRALLRPRYGAFGMLALPSLWILLILFSAIAPFVDLVLLWSIVQGNFPQVAFYYAVFLLIELSGAWVAYSLDRERKWPLIFLLLQRMAYRQILVYVVIRSIIRAASGMRTGWGKLERRGTAKAHV